MGISCLGTLSGGEDALVDIKRRTAHQSFTGLWAGQIKHHVIIRNIGDGRVQTGKRPGQCRNQGIFSAGRRVNQPLIGTKPIDGIRTIGIAT